MRACCLALAIAFAPVHAQILHANGPLPSYEVATVKPVESTPPPSAGAPPVPHDEMIMFMPARILIASAFNVGAFSKSEVIGGPSWIDEQVYEIQAKINGPLSEAMQHMSNKERQRQIALMDQSLLADRFGLKVHFESRELPQFNLVVAKSGTKLKPAANPSAHAPIMSKMVGTGMDLQITSTTTDMLATILGFEPKIGGRPVINQTGLTGLYDVTLDWTPSRVADTNPDASGPSLFTALEEQLGLKLVETKGPVEVVVIDHIEKPSEN
jgi:uncharacterized protein (TIGR03435 family)